jgi:hypothetical protein
MKYLKILGLAAVAALALTAFAASSASATTLEVGGVKQTGAVTIEASLATGTKAVLSRTDGSLANECTESVTHGTTTVFTGSVVTGPLTGHTHQERTEGRMGLTFGNCTRPVTVHDPGTLSIEHKPVEIVEDPDGKKTEIATPTNGTVFSENAEVTVSTPFGTVNCKTGAGTDIGTLTGVKEGHATMHINAVLNCGFLLPSALWRGTYTVTSPTGLGVVA